MIINEFSAFGLLGKHSRFSSTWYLDSRATNQLTSSSAFLKKFVDYKGSLKVQTADGENLPITTIGDVISPLPLQDFFFVSPRLPTNLVFVGQLVENNCNILFSSSGYVVQD